MSQICNHCHGSGYMISSHFLGFMYSHHIDKCTKCHGSGRITKRTEEEMKTERLRRQKIYENNVKGTKYEGVPFEY